MGLRWGLGRCCGGVQLTALRPLLLKSPLLTALLTALLTVL